MKKWLVLPALLFCIPALAGPADYVYVPAVQHGEREVDIKYGAASPAAGSSAQAASIGLGFGARERWFTELYLKKENIGGSHATVAEWENKFQLTETGQYPIDLGFITELEAPLSGDAPREVRAGALLQTELGKLQLNGNLLFEHAYGTRDEGGPPYATNLLYQWQARYRSQPAFDFGLQGFGEMGKWNNWNPSSQQNHRIGPAVMGKLLLGGRNAICYNAAWLLGASQAAPNHTFRMQVEYEF